MREVDAEQRRRRRRRYLWWKRRRALSGGIGIGIGRPRLVAKVNVSLYTVPTVHMPQGVHMPEIALTARDGERESNTNALVCRSRTVYQPWLRLREQSCQSWKES